MNAQKTGLKQGMKKSDDVPWKKYERFDRVGHVHVDAEASRVFPLLCPVLEYDWIPDWTCTMAYSRSRVAEKDAVFFTKETFGMKAVWTCITYEPDSFIEYLIVSGSRAVVRLSLRLSKLENGSTDIEWSMKFTTGAGFFSRVIGHQFSAERFDAMMKTRTREFARYFGRIE